MRASRWLLILGCLLLAWPVGATPVQRTINYQGRLTDLSGNAVTNGTYTITFRLYQDPNQTIGQAVWTEIQNNVIVNNGYFSVRLGSVTPLASRDFDFNDQYWLGIKVGDDSEMLPRQVLNSMPAALNSDVPIGTIMAWHKSMATDGTPMPALPANWQECNGQILSDSESIFNGKVIPNLNGNPSGSASPAPTPTVQKLFLRGGTTSGSYEEDQFQGHKHKLYYEESGTPGTNFCIGYTQRDAPGESNTYNTRVMANAQNITTDVDPTYGRARVSAETRPKSMSVVWIMKIK